MVRCVVRATEGAAVSDPEPSNQVGPVASSAKRILVDDELVTCPHYVLVDGAIR